MPMLGQGQGNIGSYSYFPSIKTIFTCLFFSWIIITYIGHHPALGKYNQYKQQ
jgi:hypothetical protein